MRPVFFLLLGAIILMAIIEIVDLVAPPKSHGLSQREMINLRDSILIDAMQEGVDRSLGDPYMDSVINNIAARRADSMYLLKLKELQQYD